MFWSTGSLLYHQERCARSVCTPNFFIRINIKFELSMEILWFIYLIFYRSVTLRRDYLISCSMTTFCFLLIPFSTFVPSISSYILSLAFFFSGFFRVYIIVPYLIVTQYFDPVVRNKTSINIWNSIHAMGDVFAILFTYYLLSDLKWSWEASLIANLALYISFSILMYLVTSDI